MSGGKASVRPAGPADAAVVARFIRDLARYERLEHRLDLDEQRLRSHLAGPTPACSALVAEIGGEAVGFALYFVSYSTFRTRPCLWLEDLFVAPEHRGAGVGLQLFRAVAEVAVARDCPRLDWCVLDWNAGAIAFYERHGARVLADWRVCRLEGDALSRVARGG